jgi:Mrp family chromosome partitioning ATPase/capsular polysaccharide biosynthesis protein
MAQQRRQRPNDPRPRKRGRGPLVEGLRRLWWIPMGAFLVFALLGFARSMTQSAQYSSTAQVVVKGFDNLSSQLSSGGSTSLQDPNKTVATLKQLVKVDEIVDEVAATVGLPQSANREIKRKTAIQTQVDSDLIGIQVTWTDEAMSRRLAQAYAEEFVKYRARLDTAPLLAAQSDIRNRIDAAEASGTSSDYVQQLLNTELDLRTRIAIGSHNSEVAERASDPVQVAPTPLKTMILFGIGGLALSLFVVAILQATDNRVRSDSDAGRALGCGTLAVIPRPRSAERRQSLVMLDDSGAAAADPYRVLATNIELNGAGRERRTVLVASPLPDAGTSTVAANVAVAAARGGRLVALCDLNLRRPEIGTLFGLGHVLGAGDVLSGEATLDDALHPIALGDDDTRLRSSSMRRRRGAGAKAEDDHVVGPISGLWVMPAGAIAGSPADLAGSVRVAQLVAALRERFELVLLDVPPWMVAGDALAIGRHVDAVLPVVQSGSSRRSLTLMRRGLQQLRVHVLGMAFTDAHGESAGALSDPAYGPVADDEHAGDEARTVIRIRSRIAALLPWGRG